MAGPANGANGGRDFFQRLSDGVKRAADGVELSKIVDQVNQMVGESIGEFSGPRESKPGRNLIVERPQVTFDDVGGLPEAKAELEAICLALREPGLYERWGARPPRGLLLFGPPGTGKTLLARCLAGQADAPFFHVKVVDVASMWYGEAEKRLQAVFDAAHKQPRAIIFIDEIDALVPPRETAHEATHRVISTLLENLDGLEDRGNLLVVASTNRPESVDPAFLRPGRIDRLIEVPLPDPEARREIFLVHMGRAERRAGRQLFEEFSWKRLLRATGGMSGAEIEEIVRRALEGRVRHPAEEGEEERLLDEQELVDEVRGFAWLRKPSPAASGTLQPRRRSGWRLWS
jgi:transitional endoplasmic reticulum ATPase